MNLLFVLAACLLAAPAAHDPVLGRVRQLKFRAPSGWTEHYRVVPDTVRLTTYSHPQHAARLVVGYWLHRPAPAPARAVHRLLYHTDLRPAGPAKFSAVGTAVTTATGYGHYRGRPVQYEARVYEPGTAAAVVHLYWATTPWAPAESPLRLLLPEWAPQPMPVVP
ncbi:hypothetical protein GCM10027048_03580 [Hymenobacter coalescens]